MITWRTTIEGINQLYDDLRARLGRMASKADLLKYYLKSETYNRTEILNLISDIKQFEYVVAEELPTASASTMHKIYLIPSSDPKTQNVKDEFITIESSGTYSWEQIGSTNIPLDNYYTKGQVDTLLDTKVDKPDEVTAGNVAVLNSYGNISDGGKSLDDLVSFTDYANGDKGGVLKTGNLLNVYSTGGVYAVERTKEQYDSTSNSVFISKGTLENLRAANYLVGSDYVDNAIATAIGNAIEGEY